MYASASTAPATQPAQALKLFLDLFGKRTIGDNIGNSQPAARFEHPECFGKNPGLVRREVDYAIGDDDIHRAGCNRQLFEIALAEFHVLQIQTPGTGLGALDHFGNDIHADHMSRFANFPGRKETIQPGAGAQVQDSLTGLQGCQCDRIAASVTNDRLAFWQRGKQVCRVKAAFRAAAACTAIRRSAAGGIALDAFCIMFTNDVMNLIRGLSHLISL